MNQIDIPDYQYYLSCNAKRVVCLTFLENKFVFQSEFSTYSIFKIIEVLSGQGVVQIKPNSVWRIPGVCRV